MGGGACPTRALVRVRPAWHTCPMLRRGIGPTGALVAWAATLALVAMPRPATAQAAALSAWETASGAGERALLEGRLGDAASHWEAAVVAAEQAGQPADHARALAHLAVIEDLRGNYALANTIYEQAQRRAGPALTCVFSPIAAQLVDRAFELRRTGQYVLATRLYQRALMVVNLPIIPAGHDPVRILQPFPTLLGNPVDVAAAQAAYSALLDEQVAVQGADHPDTAWTVTALGDLAAAQERFGDAEQWYVRAYRVRRAALGPEDVETMQSLGVLQSFFESQGQTQDAWREYQYTLEAWEDMQQYPREPTVGDLHAEARTAELAGATAEADATYRAMFEQLPAAPERYRAYPGARIWLADYARFLRATDRPDVADAVERAAPTILILDGTTP